MEDIKFLASQISSTARQADEQLSNILKTSDLQDICYAYKSRIKQWDKLTKKVEIKKKNNHDYNIGSITDVLGLRVVTLFRKDMRAVTELILSLISHKTEHKPNPFLKDSLVEAIIYTPSIGNDPIISEIINTICSYNLLPRWEIKEEASAARYSSIHLVSKIDLGVPEFNSTYKIPIEIQIRTVFEDAWGEIDHKYGYQGRSGKNESKIQNPILVEKNLLTLKKLLDSCAEYADNIKDMAIGNSGQIHNGTIQSLDTDELVKENLKSLGVKDSVIEAYMSLRHQRALTKTESSSKTKQIFSNTAEGLNKLARQITDNRAIDSKEGERLFLYYVKMDESLCRLSTGNESETLEAINNYQYLIKKYPSYPVIRFRLGQALLKISKFDLAREQLKRCRKYITILSKFPEDKRKISLPNQELKRIEVGLYTTLGLAYWKEARRLLQISPPDINRIQQNFEQAYTQTLPGFKVSSLSEEQKLSLLNNTIYFSLEIVYFNGLTWKREKFNTVIEEMLPEFERLYQASKIKKITQADTLMCAYDYTKQFEKAQSIAKELIDLLIAEESQGREVDRDILTKARNLLSGKDNSKAPASQALDNH
ncbi:hypothetical protein ACVBEJ_13715 [Porticoccus sp. GXU_MW_L64]